jgi:predicted DNA-binding transcriptional regulator AlpA
VSKKRIDEWEAERLWRAVDVAQFLQIAKKDVYALPIPRVQVSARRVRWRPEVVRQYIRRRED